MCVICHSLKDTTYHLLSYGPIICWPPAGGGAAGRPPAAPGCLVRALRARVLVGALGTSSVSAGLPSLSGDGSVTRPGLPGLAPGSTPRALLARGIHALSWRVGPWGGREMSCARPREGVPKTSSYWHALSEGGWWVGSGKDRREGHPPWLVRCSSQCRIRPAVIAGPVSRSVTLLVLTPGALLASPGLVQWVSGRGPTPSAAPLPPRRASNI